MTMNQGKNDSIR